jgi:putative DNA primase/helicase
MNKPALNVFENVQTLDQRSTWVLKLSLDARNVDPTRFRQTDAGNGLLFVELFKENIRYVEPWKLWIRWDGKRWIETSDTALLPLARLATERIFERAAKIHDSSQQEALRRHALASQKEPRLRAMLNIAKGEPEIRVEPDRLDVDPMLLGCRNGTLDLRTGELREARRDDFITKSVAVAYDEAAQCPNWSSFLRFVAAGDAETIEHLQRFGGYALTGSVEEEKLFPFFGDGKNGKTTLVMTLMAMMGDYAGKARKDLLMHSQGQKGAASPDVAALVGKRLVVVSETDAECTLAEAQVKEITSNEEIAARRNYGDPFTFMPTHKTVLMTNHRPLVKGTDDGIWRRLNIVSFKAKVADAEADPMFREKRLVPELPGILRWAVEGALKWLRDGLKPSAAVRQAAAAYRAEMDIVGQWIEERCEPNARATDFTVGALAYGDYERWAKSEGLPPLGRRKFGQELRSRGFLQAESGDRRFRGLKLRSAYNGANGASEAF